MALVEWLRPSASCACRGRQEVELDNGIPRGSIAQIIDQRLYAGYICSKVKRQRRHNALLCFDSRATRTPKCSTMPLRSPDPAGIISFRKPDPSDRQSIRNLGHHFPEPSFETMKGHASHSPPSQTSITGARRPIERARHSKRESLLFPSLTRDMFASRLRRQSNTYNPLRASHRNASTSP